MARMRPVSCAGSPKLSNSHSCCPCKDEQNQKPPGTCRHTKAIALVNLAVAGSSLTTKMTETSNLHIAVVGGGPGGYAAAFLAADLGLKVTLIDPEVNPGGVCLYRGCIPSKALLHVAKLIDESRHARNWGIDFADPKIDVARLRSWKEGVIKKLTGGLGQLSKQHSVQYMQGRAGSKIRILCAFRKPAAATRV